MAARKTSRQTSPKSRTHQNRSNKRIRIALVGCGGMGYWHAKMLIGMPEVQVVAICDIVKGQMRKFQKELFGPAGLEPVQFTSYDRMLADTKLDAVELVTPHTTHYSQALAALKKGLHVLCEKPLVTNSEHARELVALAERKNRLLSIAFQAPASAEFAYAANVIRRGELGRLETVDVHVAQSWMKPLANTWRHDPKFSGGGFVYDSGAHALNSMMWLVDSPVRRVFAVLDNCGAKVDINGSVSVVFENGCLGTASFAGNSSLPIASWVHVYGSDGMIKTGIWGGELEHYTRDRERVRYPHVPYPALTVEQNFVDALFERDALRCPGRYGILLAELMDAIYESAQTGFPVDVQHRIKPAGPVR